jgi:FkbM family methyltransferase
VKKIETLNYVIHPLTSKAYRFLKLSSYNFKGSTTLLFFFCKLFFRNDYILEINGIKKAWPIDSISDFRLLRGEYLSTTGKYSVETGYEGIDLAFVKTLLSEGDIILDLGANKGFYSLFFSCFIGDKGKVISIEASPDNFKTFLLRIKNVWNLVNVLPFNFILGKSDSELVSLQKPSFFDDGTGFYLKNEKKINKKFSYTRSIDKMLGFLNIDKIKMIKIDVEGAEFGVLSGATEILKKTEFLLVEISEEGANRFDSSAMKLYELLKSNNFIYAYTISFTNNEYPSLTLTNDAIGNVLFSKHEIFV